MTTTERPKQNLEVTADAITLDDFADQHRWAGWIEELEDKGKPRKVPYDPRSGRPARTDVSRIKTLGYEVPDEPNELDLIERLDTTAKELGNLLEQIGDGGPNGSSEGIANARF